MKYNLYVPEEQPDILAKEHSFADIEWTSAQIFENLYDTLMKKYPEYIHRVFLGKDTSGKYDMFAYEFCPKQYSKTIYIQSGVHCLETEGYFGLARLMTMICQQQDSRMKKLHDNVRFLVVPCFSVYGISEKGSYENIMANNRYDIQNNALGINPNRDFYDCRLSETRNIRHYFEQYAEEINIAFDFHTTTNAGWNCYLLPYADGLEKQYADKLLFVNESLYQLNCEDKKKSFMGEEKDYPTGAITGSFTGGFLKEYGVPSATIEHSDYIFDDVLGTSKTMTRAVELYANHVLSQMEF